LVIPCLAGRGHPVQGDRAKARATSERRLGVEECREQDQKWPFPATARRAALGVGAEMRDLRPVDSNSHKFSKTLTDRLVREAAVQRVGLRKARSDQIAATDPCDRRVVADDLSVVYQGGEITLHLVEDFLGVLGGPCTEEELSGVHYPGFELRPRAGAIRATAINSPDADTKNLEARNAKTFASRLGSFGRWALIGSWRYFSRVFDDILFSVANATNDYHWERHPSSFDTCPESTLRPALTM